VVETAGGRKHVLSYLGDFLFPPQRADTPVRALSGGERNRLLLARLFARPANLLVLDEPTNDLDIESLELLESTLQTFPGTLLLVSHDRTFLDNVVTQTLVAELRAGDVAGTWHEYVGGYSDWVAQRPKAAAPPVTVPSGPSKAAVGPSGGRASPPAAASPGKLTFAERRELAALPDELEALEREQHALTRAHVPRRLSSGKRRHDQGGPAARRGNRAHPRAEVRALGRPRRAQRRAWRGLAPARREVRGAAPAGQNATGMSPGDMPGSLPCQPAPGTPLTIRDGLRSAGPVAGGRPIARETRVPDNIEDDLDLSSLNDEDLTLQVHDDLYNGLREEVMEATNILLSRSWSPDRVLNDALVEGMRIVGIDFRDGILFVPEVLLAANAMKGGMEILRPLLAETGVEPIGKMVIGTVKGDIHDIGKNLVAMMMEGAGFEVIDLGINNSVEKYLAALSEHKAGHPGSFRAAHDDHAVHEGRDRHDEGPGHSRRLHRAGRRRAAQRDVWQGRRGRRLLPRRCDCRGDGQGADRHAPRDARRPMTG
jgi:hypothetical protein